MTVNDRFEILMKRMGLNAHSMAAELGFAGPVIYNIIGGRKSKPSYDLLNSIKMRFPDVNLNWLVSNEGEMELVNQVSEPRITYQAKEDHTIPVIPYKSLISSLRTLSVDEVLDVADRMTLPKWMLRQGTHAAVQVRGLAMQGILHDGSYVIVRRIDQSAWSQFVNGNIHLVYTEDYGIQIKFLKRNERNPSFLILESENSSEHPPINIHFNEIIHLWEVEVGVSFKFASRKGILQKLGELEMSYNDLFIGFDQLKQKFNEYLDKKS